MNEVSCLIEEDRDNKLNFYMLIITNWLRKNFDKYFSGDTWRGLSSSERVDVFDKMMKSFMVQFAEDISNIGDRIRKEEFDDAGNVLKSRLIKITQYDRQIQSFTKRIGIVDAHESHDMEIELSDGINPQFKVLLNGKDNTEMKARAIEKVTACKKLLDSEGKCLILEDDDEKAFSDCIQETKFSNYKNDAFAIVMPDKPKGAVLILTLYGIIYMGKVRKFITPYTNVAKGKKRDRIRIELCEYTNAKIDIGALYTLCVELSGVLEKSNMRREWADILLPDEEEFDEADFLKMRIEGSHFESTSGTRISVTIISGFIVKGESVQIKKRNKVKSSIVTEIVKNGEVVNSAVAGERVSILVKDIVNVTAGDELVNLDSRIENS